MFNEIKKTFILFLTALVLTTPAYTYADSNDLMEKQSEEVKDAPKKPITNEDLKELREEMDKLDNKTGETWAGLTDNQRNSEWVDDAAAMGVAGEIYSKGWFGPAVSRQIVPDMHEGFLAVDTVTIPPSLLLTGTTLAANIVLQYYVPYVQMGPIKERSFVNVRKYETYREALLAPHFRFSRFPLFTEEFEKLNVGEQISTVNTYGFYVRFGGGIANLIGLELPAHVNIGPKLKFTAKSSLKLTIAKQEKKEVLISMERAKEVGMGFGFGFGIFFDDIIDIPVAIGINNSSGYSPIVFNYKVKRSTIKALVWKLDLANPKAEAAYHAFLGRDFTMLEDLCKQEGSGVELEIIKEGDIYESEMNAAIDLLIWRAGYRNVFKEAKFNTTDKMGNRFEYAEVEEKEITDFKWFGNREHEMDHFSALVPVKGTSPEYGDISNKGGFILDSHFLYADSQAYGSELREFSEMVTQAGTQLKLPVQFRDDKYHDRAHIDVRVRFTVEAIRDFLTVQDDLLWESIAYAVGIPDPMDWSTLKARQNYIRNSRGSVRDSREKLLKEGEKIYNWVYKVRREKTLLEKATTLIDYLHSGQRGRTLHKVIMDVAGQDRIMVRGFIRGKHF